MTHPRELVARSLDRDLSLEEHRTVDAHLARCAECRELAAELRATERLLTTQEPALTVPPFSARQPAAGGLGWLMAPLALAAIVVIVTVIGVRDGGVATRSPVATATSPAGGAPGSAAQAIAWRTPGGITACGTVSAYTPATATEAGSLTIGSRSYEIKPGTPNASGTGFPPTAGRAMCVWGGLAGSSNVAAGADPLGEYRCGRVRAVAPGRLTLLDYWSGGELQLPLAPGTNVGQPPVDAYRCITVGVAATGDVEARGVNATSLAQQELHCGRVDAYQPATATTAGTLTLGTRTFVLPAGVTYRHDPLGSRDDVHTVGAIVCLSARLDDSGRIFEYGPNHVLGRGEQGQLTPTTCGRVMVFTPPTSTMDGSVALSYKSSLVRIPAGTMLTPKAGDPHRCYDFALDGNGDVVVLRDRDEEPGGAFLN